MKMWNSFGKQIIMELHTIPILSPQTKKMFLQWLEKTKKFVSGDFQVVLLWKDDFPILQCYQKLAIQRSDFIEKRFTKSPEFLNMSRAQINDYTISK